MNIPVTWTLLLVVESITPFKKPFRICYPGFGTQFLFNHSSAYENCSFNLVNKYLLSAFPHYLGIVIQLGFLLEGGAGIWGRASQAGKVARITGYGNSVASYWSTG